MSAFVSAPWLGVAVPALLAVLVLAVGRVSRSLVPWVASIAPLVVAGSGAVSLAASAQGGHVSPWTSELASSGGYEWFRVGAHALRIGWTVDSLASLMLLVVGVVALMVMVFSAGYMHGDEGWTRYYALLCLFTASMTLLVIGNSLVTLFIGWELVGVSSYLLIGFWFRKPSAAAAAVKAFLTTRVGDVGLLLGLAVLWSACHTLDYAEVMRKLPGLSPGVLSAAALLIAVGAIGKSAQFPLHIWLPDAMEGPTPVSALIHAATMVAAGVYLVARVWPLFEAAPSARMLLLVAGTVSALGAALAAVAQRDIKRVLAYSTISQLGFMFAALGAGAWAVAFFHLVTHAAFKALLFLTAGSIIHGADTQDLREMGGLRREMPVTFVVWLIGIGTLVGVPPLAGFFSKDLIVEVVEAAHPWAGAALFTTVFVTGLYSARATRLAFFGTSQRAKAAHEGGIAMLAPLVALAIPATVLGFAGSWMLAALGHEPEALSIPLSAAAVGAALAGAVAGWYLMEGEGADSQLEAKAGLAWRISASAFGFDTAVDRVVVRPTVWAARGMWRFIDRVVIDGVVEGSAAVARRVGALASAAQTGDTQRYAAAIVIGVAVLLGVGVWMGR